MSSKSKSRIRDKGEQGFDQNSSERAVVNLRDDQLSAFEAAKNQILADIQEGSIDARITRKGPHEGTIPDGEILRIACEAYIGELEFNG
jgi:hypothetical protein